MKSNCHNAEVYKVDSLTMDLYKCTECHVFCDVTDNPCDNCESDGVTGFCKRCGWDVDSDEYPTKPKERQSEKEKSTYFSDEVTKAFDKATSTLKAMGEGDLLGCDPMSSIRKLIESKVKERDDVLGKVQEKLELIKERLNAGFNNNDTHTLVSQAYVLIRDLIQPK